MVLAAAVAAGNKNKAEREAASMVQPPQVYSCSVGAGPPALTPALSAPRAPLSFPYQPILGVGRASGRAAVRLQDADISGFHVSPSMFR